MVNTINVGVIGVGVVGSAVIKLLEENRDIILARSGANIVVKKAAVRDINKVRDIKTPLTTNIDEILDDDEIDIIVELMGGVDLAFSVAKKALKNKKSLVTANKAMLAYHGYDLGYVESSDVANEIPIYFEASVAGGIPIIKALREGLSANHILSIRGILNGTCNYILTKMSNSNISFEECLKEAQELGYAELDPTLDISGMDSAHKLIILSSIAYGIRVLPEDILVEGISGISQDDIFFAKEFGYVIKLLAVAKKIDNKIELRVHLAMINKDEMIGNVAGAMNGISVIGDKVGETMFYGAGAGGNPTASAVVSDIIEIARDNLSPMLGFRKPLESGLTLREISEIESRYYIRLKVVDKAGTLAKITSILGENQISIKMLIQKEAKDSATLLLSTHKSLESNIQKALSDLSKLDIITQKPFMIRIEH